MPKTSHRTLTTLVEQWMDASHTFHFTMGEVTITPSDFVAITGLRWAEEAIEFNCYMDPFSLPENYIEHMLGVASEDGKLLCTDLKAQWLSRHAVGAEVPDDQRDQYFRAILAHLLSCVFFPTG